MKFGKRLREIVQESDEEWRPNFMDYKKLKKCINPSIDIEQGEQLKQTRLKQNNSESRDDDEDDEDEEFLVEDQSKLSETIVINDDPNEQEQLISAHKQAVQQAESLHTQFFQGFKLEVEKVNEFFLEKQEDFIIEHRLLSSRVDNLLKPAQATRKDINDIREKLTNFHAELVVLEKFSTVNYTGFRKILKKHDKKTGLNIQSVYLNCILVTPFFLSDTIRRLILSTEALLAKLNNVVKFKKNSN